MIFHVCDVSCKSCFLKAALFIYVEEAWGGGFYLLNSRPEVCSAKVALLQPCESKKFYFDWWFVAIEKIFLEVILTFTRIENGVFSSYIVYLADLTALKMYTVTKLIFASGVVCQKSVNAAPSSSITVYLYFCTYFFLSMTAVSSALLSGFITFVYLNMSKFSPIVKLTKKRYNCKRPYQTTAFCLLFRG